MEFRRRSNAGPDCTWLSKAIRTTETTPIEMIIEKDQSKNTFHLVFRCRSTVLMTTLTANQSEDFDGNFKWKKVNTSPTGGTWWLFATAPWFWILEKKNKNFVIKCVSSPFDDLTRWVCVIQVRHLLQELLFFFFHFIVAAVNSRLPKMSPYTLGKSMPLFPELSFSDRNDTVVNGLGENRGRIQGRKKHQSTR